MARSLHGGIPRSLAARAGSFLGPRVFACLLSATALAPSFAAESLPADEPVGRDLSAWRDGDVAGSTWGIVGGVAVKPEKPRELALEPGTGVLVNVAREPGPNAAPKNIHTKKEYGDVEVHVEFLVPQGSNSGVYLMGRYEVQILDSWDSRPGVDKPKADPTYSDCGGVYQRWDPARGPGNEGFEGRAPRVNASKKWGEWQSFDIAFRAPRFDASGRRTEKARFLKVVHNGTVVHADVELSGPTRAATWESDEKPLGPLMLQGDHGPVAFRNIRIRPLAGGEAAAGIRREVFDETGFVSIFDGKTLAGWHASAKTGHSAASRHASGGRWLVEDGAIAGTQDIPGNGGILITDAQYRDFEVALEMRNDFGPDSGLFLRSTEDGRAYQYLVDYHSGGNVGGLYGEGLSPGFHVRNYAFLDSPSKIRRMEAPDPLPVSPEEWPSFWKHGEWNELRARIVGNPPTITTWVNGVRFHEWTDTRKRLPDSGGIALQVHGGGDLTKQFVRYRNIRVKALDPK